MAVTEVLVDTGPLVAYFNRRDKHHDWVVERWATLFDPVLTCESVISEAAFLLREDGLDTEKLWSALERGVVQVQFDFAAHQRDLLRLLRKYQDQPMSVADACLVRLSELTDRSVLFTTDEDFRIYRRHGRGLIPLIAPFET
jgi:uncharacterized protein